MFLESALELRAPQLKRVSRQVNAFLWNLVITTRFSTSSKDFLVYAEFRVKPTSLFFCVMPGVVHEALDLKGLVRFH